MNVEKINALEQIKLMLKRAETTADRQLREPFGDKESVTSYLLCKISIVTNEIDAFIEEEENAFEVYYSREVRDPSQAQDNTGLEGGSTKVNISVEDFPLDDDSEIQMSVTPNPNTGKTGTGGFNPLIHDCASEISEAFSDCWVSVKALKPNSSNPEYTISIQPSGYTPNDIQLKLRSLGYAPTFKKISEHVSNQDLTRECSAWVYFDVSLKADSDRKVCTSDNHRALSSTNGIAFELSSTVDSIEPPEFDRYSEPATDDELLPF